MLKSAVTLVTAIALIVAGGVLIAFMFQNVAATDDEWQRYVYLLSGVEAVVFAAVRWLFGKEVHREQAATAEAARKASEEEKGNAVADAAGAEAKGRELARAILSTAGGNQQQQAMIGGGDGPMAHLVRHARSAYPDV
jgi:hypothetical protein